MMLLTMRSLVLVLLCTSLTASAQEVTIAAEPERNYLLDVTRSWSRVPGLGDLRARPLGPDDVELRFWGGYGIVGTRGVTIRCLGGTWEAFAMEVTSCPVPVPAEIENDAAALAAFRRRVGVSDCPEEPGEGLMVLADTTLLSAPPRGAELAVLWDDLIAAGLLVLPPEADPERLMLDGHTYVVEVRVGDTYRAAVIEHGKPELEADRQIQALARLLRERLGLFL